MENLKTELYRAIKAIEINNLNDADKEEVLRLFMVTKNDLIRNQIAFIFEDTHYERAVPYIIKKIKDKSTFHNNGSLVFVLESLDVKKSFIVFVKIIFEHEYEPRLIAYGIVEKYAS